MNVTDPSGATFVLALHRNPLTHLATRRRASSTSGRFSQAVLGQRSNSSREQRLAFFQRSRTPRELLWEERPLWVGATATVIDAGCAFATAGD